MAWAKIDDRFFSHPKVRRAGKDAVLLYLAGLTYCNEHLTDGFICEDALPLLGFMAFVDDVKQSSSKLLDTGLWDVSSKGSSKGYEVHDYFDHNPTRIQVEETKKARTEAGSRGGIASAASKSQQNPSKPQAKGQANPKQSSSNIPSPPLPSPPYTPGTDVPEESAAVPAQTADAAPPPVAPEIVLPEPEAPKPDPAAEPKPAKRLSVKATVPDGVIFYHNEIGRYPPKELYERVDQLISQRRDAVLLRQCHGAWIARGFNPQNLEGWLFDWYANGAIPERQHGGNGHKAQAPPGPNGRPLDEVDLLIARRAEQARAKGANDGHN